MTPYWGCVHLGAMLDPSWAMLDVGWGYVELCSKLGLGWPILGVCWGYGSLNGSMLTHFEVLLGRPSAVYVGAKFVHLELCWGYGCVIFMMSPSFPNFATKKLSPVACESYV